MVFATLGTFATGGGFADLLLLYVLGMLGVLMALAKVPVAPAIVGLILGPLFEEQLLRAVLLEGGSICGLFASTLITCVADRAARAGRPDGAGDQAFSATTVDEKQPVSR